MPVLLLRHADAGSRADWASDDLLRPLDGRGRRQAEGLPAILAAHRVERVLTSPYLRCRQTVEPLAQALALPVEERQELAEGATAAEALGLVAGLGGATAVLCTHGDVVFELIGEESTKGSTWVLELGDAGTLDRLAYLLPAR